MNLVLRMIKGPAVGSCRVLQLGQQACVGADDSCHWFVDSQPGLQFRCGCSSAGGWVEDRSDAPKLRVNGLPASRAAIADGDIISIGSCGYLVRIRDRQKRGAAELFDVCHAGSGFRSQFAGSGGFRRRLHGLPADSGPVALLPENKVISAESWLRLAALSAE